MANPPSDVSALCDSFNSQASTYDRRLGGATRRIVTFIIPLLDNLPGNPTILDNASGPGFATEVLLKAYPDARIYAADVAPGMVALLDQLIASNGWSERVETAVMDGVELGYADELFDASITNFGLFFFPSPLAGARELYRTLRPGGKAAVTCWNEVPFLPILHAVQAILKPGTKPITLPKLEEWTDPETMEGVLREGGFEEVKMEKREVMWWNRGVEEAARGFADNFENMVGDQWTSGEKSHILKTTAQVLEKRGKEFVVESEGMIGFRMVAWIAVGTREAQDKSVVL